ncbi:hypothetical protein HER32_13990 [Hymenobacter sp. BT18]|uniref:HEPN domain-containing protein n=1 Tax=Hymenobacter sp. BT18 TaxID=2835648 RepID=UPI00143E54BE|nr:HEPN domain-containing protein [Hymenobacter sp. BT18]QIX62230.1 hypothetical protein HER32_13990 [Hymenobacter sp. BT18]
MTREITSYKNRLDYLFSQAGIACNQDDEMMAHWARYLCVRCAGFIEVAIPKLFVEYCKGHSHNIRVYKFLTTQLDAIQNVKAEKIVVIVGYFDSKWATDVQDYMNEEGRKEAINSIVAQRHLIAHGKDSSLSFASLQGYYKKLIEVFDYIKSILFPI